MELNDHIIIVMDSNASKIEANYVSHDQTGLYFVKHKDNTCWFMPWHAIRIMELVSATADVRQKLGMPV